MTEENRVANAIRRTGQRIEGLSDDRRKQMEDMAMKVTLHELVVFQDVKSMGQAMGRITVDEATTVYEILGGEAPSVEHWLSRSLAERIVATTLMGELMCSMRADEIPKPKRRRR